METPHLEVVIQAAKTLYPAITAELSSQSSKSYNELWTLKELDDWRNSTLPATLQKRYESKNLHLTKDELVLIMDWKLAKGKFRPTLPKLIKSNDKDNVTAVTSAGFGIFMDYVQLAKNNWLNTTVSDYQAAVKLSVKKLCELKGVGPATASLLLSLLNDTTILAPPFFSDEAFMYFIQEPLRPGLPIKYNMKEYVDEYVGTLYNLLTRSSLKSMDELEKGGWALKLYEMRRITLLANVKLEFNVSDVDLEKFSEAQKYQSLPVSKKRKASIKTEKKSKKAKLE